MHSSPAIPIFVSNKATGTKIPRNNSVFPTFSVPDSDSVVRNVRSEGAESVSAERRSLNKNGVLNRFICVCIFGNT